MIATEAIELHANQEPKRMSTETSSQNLTTNRLVIGQHERAGHPISAPIESEGAGPITPGALRWVHKKSGTFVLEQFGRKGCCHIGWHEVPVIEEP